MIPNLWSFVLVFSRSLNVSKLPKLVLMARSTKNPSALSNVHILLFMRFYFPTIFAHGNETNKSLRLPLIYMWRLKQNLGRPERTGLNIVGCTRWFQRQLVAALDFDDQCAASCVSGGGPTMLAPLALGLLTGYVFHSCWVLGTFSRDKPAFFWILSKLPPSQFGQLVQLFSDVEIPDLKDSLGLKVLYVLY